MRPDLRRKLIRWLTHPDFIGGALIVLAVSLFLAPALRPGYTLMPLGLERGLAPWNKLVTAPNTNLLLSDPVYEYYPFRNYLSLGLQQGELPLWNPYILGGHPNQGDLLAQTFYPPNLIVQALLPLDQAWVWLIWGHLTLTGLLMYGYLRQMRLWPVAALLGALVWTFNAINIISVEIPHFLSTLAWLPGIFWLLERARQNRSWTTVVGAGFCYGAMLLAGQIQHALGAAWLIAIWALAETLLASYPQRRLELWPLIAAGTTGLLGLALGAIQLVPAAELIQLSHRAGLNNVSFDSLFINGWPWRHLITLWIPDFYGNPVHYGMWWWGEANIVETALYFGFWPLILATGCLAWTSHRQGRFWGLAFWLALLTVLGTPIAHLMRLLPGISYVSLSRLVPLVSFTGSIAAAFAFAAVRERIGTRPGTVWRILLMALILWTLISLTTVLLQREKVIEYQAQLLPQLLPFTLILLGGLTLWIAAQKYPAPALALLVLLSSGELMAWGAAFNPIHSTAILYPQNPVTDWLYQDTGLYRVLPLQSDRPVFGPNVLSVFRIQDPDGYTSTKVQRYQQLSKAIQNQIDIWWMGANPHMLVHSRFDPLFSMLNVKYVLSSYQLPEALTVETMITDCRAEIPLQIGKPITGQFQVAHPGLNRVDLHFVPERSGTGTLKFRLRRAGQLLADLPFSAGEIGADGGKAFYFAAVSDSRGETFSWELTAESDTDTVALCGAAADQPAFTAYSTQLRFVATELGVWIYENPNVLPRAYVGHYAQSATDEQALAAIQDKNFDPWHAVLVAPPLAPALQPLTENDPQTPLTPATVIDYRAHQVTVEVDNPAPGILVLADTWYPGWEVTIDGRPAELLQVNYALRGVALESGIHRIQFNFRPLSVYLGLGITLGALLLSALILYLDHYRKNNSFFARLRRAKNE